MNRTYTGRDGAFAMRRLCAIPFGSWLRVTSPDLECVTGKIRLSVGEVVPLGKITVPKANIVQGTLLDDHGTPRRGIEVNLARTRTAEAFEGMHVSITDRFGHFRFRGLPAGDYQLMGDNPHSTWKKWPTIGSVSVREGQRVTVLGEQW
jgi:hypothetical protein